MGDVEFSNALPIDRVHVFVIMDISFLAQLELCKFVVGAFLSLRFDYLRGQSIQRHAGEPEEAHAPFEVSTSCRGHNTGSSMM